MQPSGSPVTFECRSCGKEMDWRGGEKRCTECESWPTVPFGRPDHHPEKTATTPATSMWDFDALLPYESGNAISLGEGTTPIVENPELAQAYGIEDLWIKDEGQNPTGTVHDRELSLAATDAVARGVETVSLVSPGAAVQSFGAYTARADLVGAAGLPARAPFKRKAMSNVHDVDLTVVRGRLQETREEFAELRTNQNLGLPFDAFRNPFRHAGARPIAGEIVRFFHDSKPDGIVVPTGSGTVLVGIYEGFQALVEWGHLREVPQLFAVQSEGCAPIVEAARSGHQIEVPSNPDTVCGELEVPNPRGGQWVLDVLEATGGTGVAVSDEEVLSAGIEVARQTGLELSPDAAAGPAGVKKLRETGILSDDSSMLTISTGTGGADLLRSRVGTQ